MISEKDRYFMTVALNMASRGIGRVSPNPAVGCVIVKNGLILARAHTADSGRPHAETQALKQAGGEAQGSILYVSFEPCTHHGETPPCVDSIIKAKVKRVVIACEDPDPRVSGKGIEALENAGILVDVGILEEQAKALNIGFLRRIEKNRPHITLKLACTLDGKVALANGKSQWITGELARRHVHLMRSMSDAIMVGSGTVLHDDPKLDTRLPGIEHKSLRIVMDTDLSAPPSSKIFQDAKENPVLILYSAGDPKSFEEKGVEAAQVDTNNLERVMEILAERGITRLFVEGGRRLHSAFLKSRLCDELLIYRAPTLLGDDALGLSEAMNINELAARYDFERKSIRTLGQDILETYTPKG
ncbi:MAG: bifunctional diaminohydroxyphosphoribosylaminopyrimidine deaminase/5-amino-6-(5-phosphoribosylamino)uracil reductase RibD [Alphaproteobacteria bacterium]|nr:bifunctional diaminohydroxyphosphoribosylaminopyrimidine deaminase/5-amino-6-(5-phosphoribosylamino)uracil reductase RibD [Alphaproteobacteria bacterium]